jgi:hypothetical protein
MSEMVRPVRYRAGVPIYRYRTTPQIPPVSVVRFDADHPPGHGRRHIHDFPVLMYIERAERGNAVRDGDAYVLAAGEIIDPSLVHTIAAGCGVFFDPTAWAVTGWHRGRPGELIRCCFPSCTAFPVACCACTCRPRDSRCGRPRSRRSTPN